MFGLMTEREHESILLDLECELVNKTKLNEVLQERIQLGEEYRARLEMEITSLKGKNRELVHKLDGAQIEIDEKLSRIERLNMKIREQQLMLGSFEASWATRNAKAAGEEDGEQAGPVPRLAPLARDERRREASA